METKQIKISELVPKGYEIDKEQSTFENIILKPIEVKLPLSVEEIPDRRYCIDNRGNIYEIEKGSKKGLADINNLSTENRAKAFLALMQLVELRDAWNGDWRADWEDWEDWEDSDYKYCIEFIRNKVSFERYSVTYKVLHFKTQELAEKFAEKFKDLINEAKELL